MQSHSYLTSKICLMPKALATLAQALAVLAQASIVLRSLGVTNAGGRLREWHHAGRGGAHLWRKNDII